MTHQRVVHFMRIWFVVVFAGFDFAVAHLRQFRQSAVVVAL